MDFYICWPYVDFRCFTPHLAPDPTGSSKDSKILWIRKVSRNRENSKILWIRKVSRNRENSKIPCGPKNESAPKTISDNIEV